MGADMMKTRCSQKGVLMLEVLVALLIFSIGVVGMVSMQSISSANSANSEDRATAALLANDMVSELWAAFNPATKPPVALALPGDYPAWQNKVLTTFANTGSGSIQFTGNTALVTIQWTPKAASYTGSIGAPPQSQYQTQVVIQ